jgi:hypothetical protein
MSHSKKDCPGLFNYSISYTENSSARAVPDWGFFQGLDNPGCCRGNHIDLSLTILNGQSDSDLQAFPFLGGLGDVVNNIWDKPNLGSMFYWCCGRFEGCKDSAKSEKEYHKNDKRQQKNTSLT